MSGATAFRFEYDPATIRFASGAAATLGEELGRMGLDRALVVCGETVGSTPAVIDPVTGGLDARLAGVFDETTPDKRLATAHAAAERACAVDADALVGLGGGSSLDVAKLASVLAGDDRDHGTVAAELAETGTVSIRGDPLPLVAVPTTLAGADLSTGAGVTAAPATDPVETTVSGGIADRRLMPRMAVYDPELVATTPRSILAASAMNGFDKGVESLYAATATPVTDATARRGLELLGGGLPAFAAGDLDGAMLEPVVEGLLLVQYGIWRPDGTTMSLIHAFGHGLTREYPLQQGAAHAVVAPHALEYLFEQVDGRRNLLADALGVDAPSTDPEAVAAGVVGAVAGVRDALGLPAHLREVEGPDPDGFEAVAEATLSDSFMTNAPPGLDPTVEDLVGVLEAAY